MEQNTSISWDLRIPQYLECVELSLNWVNKDNKETVENKETVRNL